MHGRTVASLGAALALGWLVVQATGEPAAAAVLAGALLVLPAVPALARRTGRRRRALVAGLAALGMVLAAGLLLLVRLPADSPWGLPLQLAGWLLLLPAAPLLYAATFQIDGSGER